MSASLSVLSSYERSVVSGSDSKADAFIESKRTQAIVDRMLLAKSSPMVLPDGTSVEPTIEELLIASAIQRELENPKGLETIERMMRIRGELSDAPKEVSISLVDKDLAARSVG